MRQTGYRDLQSYLQGPEQNDQLYDQVDDEPAVVSLPDTVLYPGTVVVKATHTAFTSLTVLGSHWLLLDAERGELERFCRLNKKAF